MKTALVTGAASGIGFAVSRGLYSLGWRVLMVDKTLEECRRAAEDIASFSGGEVLPFGCDLADLAALFVVLQNGHSRVIDQRIMPADEHGDLEPQRLGLIQNMQKQLMIRAGLLGLIIEKMLALILRWIVLGI